MGIGRIELEFLLSEHRYRPITGQVVSIGRQGIGLTGEEVLQYISAYGLLPRNDRFDLDVANQHRVKGQKLLTDQSLFAAFSDCELHSLDINDYEGADIICNICDEIPPALEGKFDLVIEGGSLDMYLIRLAV